MNVVGKGNVGLAPGGEADGGELSARKKLRMAPEPSPWETRKDKASELSRTVLSKGDFCNDENMLDLICPRQ